MIKNKKAIIVLLAVLIVLAIALFIYIRHYAPLDVDEGEIVRVWYVNDCKAWSEIDELTERFNESEGEKLGIKAQSYELSSADELRQALSRIKERGLAMPDVLLCDADLAAELYEEELLVDVSEYFGSWEELFCNKDAVNASSIEGKLITVPVAMSVNIAAANKESLESGLLECESFEDLCAKAGEYYGKNGTRLFSIADYAEFFRNAMAQLGKSFSAESPHSTDSEECKYIYSLIAEAAYERGVSSAPLDPVSLVAQAKLPLVFMQSDAFVAGCTNESAESIALLEDRPIIEGGENVYSCKAYGMTIFSGDESSENAAAMFIRWFTSSEVNTELCADSGLIPGTGDIEYSEDSAAAAMFYDCYKYLKRHADCAGFEPNAAFAKNVAEFNGILRSVMDSMD